MGEREGSSAPCSVNAELHAAEDKKRKEAVEAKNQLDSAIYQLEKTLKDIKLELEMGFDPFMACAEAERCLNCDIETVFTAKGCIECDACVDICPTECITFTRNGEEDDLRGRLKAPAKSRRAGRCARSAGCRRAWRTISTS